MVEDMMIIVVCKECGCIYDYLIAKERCPLCGSREHNSMFMVFQKGSPVLREEGGSR